MKTHLSMAILAVLTVVASTLLPGTTFADTAGEHAREFDFWVGEWNVQNVHRQADGSWKDTTTAQARIQLVCGGDAVLEEWNGTNGNPLRGFSLRAYDETLERWVVMLNWTAGQASGFGRMEGVAGDGQISIYPPGAMESGQERVERYTFSKATPISCQWDAARTADAGATWQMYWIMRFTRHGKAITTDAGNAPIVPVPTQPYCDGDRFRQLDDLIGVWTGVARDGDRRGVVALRGTSMIAGCGIQLFTDITWDGADADGNDGGRVDQSFEAVAFDARTKTLRRCAVERGDQGRIRTHDTTFDDDARTWIVPQRDGSRDVWTISGDRVTRIRQTRTDGDWEDDRLALELKRVESPTAETSGDSDD